MPEVTIGLSQPRNSWTDPESGLRYYNWQGQKLVSVTTARRMAGLPFGLHNWAIGQVINHAIAHLYDYADQIDAVATEVEAGTKTQADTDATLALIKSELRKAATTERDAAAKLGTAVHDAAAAGMLPEHVAAELRPRLTQFRSWLDTSGAEIIASEFQVFNLTAGYAGTCDMLCRMRDGSIYVVDLKTGKGVYNDHLLQVTAYALAEFAGNDDVVNDALTAQLRSATGMAILHLADDHWEFLKLKAPDESGGWRAFRGLLAFAVWTAEHSTVESFTTAKREGHADIAPELVRASETSADAQAADTLTDAAIASLNAPETTPASPAAVAEMMQAAGPVILMDEDAAIFLEPTAAEIAAVDAALIPPTVPSTSWCRDFLGHQTSHRQLSQDNWTCDICVATTPTVEDENRLSADEFKGMVRAGGIDTTFLMTTARELWPQVADMRLLDDSQRGALWQVIAERWQVQHG